MPAAAPVASLPMYDWPELEWAHDVLWEKLAERLAAAGIAVPDALDRSRPSEEVWLDPGLVLSQTCGFPFASRLFDRVRLVGTPVYRAEGCEDACYCSMLVARRRGGGTTLAELAGRRVAFNARDSLSGYLALVAAMHDAGIKPDAVQWFETGSHRASVRAVAEERADLAAIDAVCWSLAAQFDSGLVARLQVIGRTPLRPALPFITARERSDAELDTLRSVLADVLRDARAGRARRALRLHGVEVIDAAAYKPLAALMS